MHTALQPQRAPWYIWLCLLASTCITFGLYWDISWHETIGRDTFWTPAHLLIQAAAVMAAIYSSYLIFGATFSKNQQARSTTVKVLGFRGPLGAFVCAWGGSAMLTSAPFDNWWHEVYGLDVKIVSPPHALLAMGIAALMWGGVLLMVAGMNRAEGLLRQRLQWMLLATGGLIVILNMLFKLEYTNRVVMHSGIFYLANAIGLPFFWEALSIASGKRWARTIMASVYTGFFLLMLWTFPLFAAEPKLGPVYQHVTHMIPLHFPSLILAPAIALDWLSPHLAAMGKWRRALIAGCVFVVTLLAVQWPFANFLMSPASRNWVFGTHYFLYFLPPNTHQANSTFAPWETTRLHFFVNMAWAFFAAMISVRVGITFGNFLRRVRR
jgi:hypothetical protein